MSYFVVEDFRLGLDRRKHVLALPPGALYSAKNANINRGGEIESAKAFVSKFDLPTNTFGMVTAGGNLYVIGSVVAPVMPSGVSYQRIQYPDGSAMTKLVHASVAKGKIFAIAEFGADKFGVFYNGVLVSDWASGAVISGMTSYSDIATHFAGIIDVDPNYAATASGPAVTINGVPGVDFTYSTTATNVPGGTSDQYATASLVQAASAATAETLATGTITFDGVDGSKLITAIQINGVDLIGPTPLGPGDDNGAATTVASFINSFTSSPKYTASAVGAVVTISAVPGSGASVNGIAINVTSGYGIGVITATNMDGGAAAMAGAPKIISIVFGGSFEAGDTYSVTLGGTVFGSAASGLTAAGEEPVFSLTHKGKTYAIAGPNLFGSAIDDPTLWNDGTGSFVIDMSSEVQGAETLTALSLFQGNMAVFSRATTQIWSFDADPANNAQIQVLPNIGTLAPRSVNAFGDSDVFFLSDTGVRSLKSRSVINTASLSDIGSPVDPLIIAAITAAGDDAQKAVSIIDPIDGRYLQQIGTTTYVFHYFPSAKVSGWTTWESGLAITDFAVLNERLYARAGDIIYLLGGDDNDKYSEQALDVQLPFIGARQIATLKHFTGIDIACDGTFTVYLLTDPSDLDAQSEIATITKSTYGLGGVPVFGEDTSVFALRFTGRAGEYGRVANIAAHYIPLGEQVPS